MSEQDLPQDTVPLTPVEYMQESFAVWRDFSARTSQLMMGQLNTATRPIEPNSEQAETLASEFLRTFSDMNLRHWQNTARLLESLPSWMRVPHNLSGSALVDWFDQMRRSETGFGFDPEKAETAQKAERGTSQKPQPIAKPAGKADDLTRIKGIGPKLSSLLNELGIYHFKQIANWSDAEARWVDDYLAFKGRVDREDWIPQARALSANGSQTLH